MNFWLLEIVYCWHEKQWNERVRWKKPQTYNNNDDDYGDSW